MLQCAVDEGSRWEGDQAGQVALEPVACRSGKVRQAGQVGG